MPAMLCVQAEQVPPENQLRYVEFGAGGQIGRETFGGGWVRETREIGGLLISAQLDDAATVERIFASARTVTDLDAVGCPVDHAVATSLDARPTTGALDPAQVGPDGAVCQYALQGGLDAPLTASARLSAEQVAAFAAAMGEAPEGGGPDTPADCADDWRRGDSALVVRLATADGVREVVVWYAGCINGADDGVTLRSLTADLLRPLFGGSVQANSFTMAVMPLMD